MQAIDDFYYKKYSDDILSENAGNRFKNKIKNTLFPIVLQVFSILFTMAGNGTQNILQKKGNLTFIILNIQIIKKQQL